MKNRTTLSLALLAAACSPPAAVPDHQDETPPPSNRIAVPDPVRRNLGIEFVPVERRRVAATLRLPGHSNCCRRRATSSARRWPAA